MSVDMYASRSVKAFPRSPRAILGGQSRKKGASERVSVTLSLKLIVSYVRSRDPPTRA